MVCGQHMILEISNILSSKDIADLIDLISKQTFVDGKTTAGWNAKLVKNNLQLPSGSDALNHIVSVVGTALYNNRQFQLIARPRVIHSMLVSKYAEGMSYGQHVDNALMGLYRSDISFTVFLNEEYTGGELCISGEEYKLEAGSAIVYPSTTLHEVKEVTKGERLVVIGWCQSVVKDPACREILYDLDTARQDLFSREGKTKEFDLISKASANLMRRWAE